MILPRADFESSRRGVMLTLAVLTEHELVQ